MKSAATVAVSYEEYDFLSGELTRLMEINQSVKEESAEIKHQRMANLMFLFEHLVSCVESGRMTKESLHDHHNMLVGILNRSTNEARGLVGA